MGEQEFEAFFIQATDWVVRAIPNLIAAILILVVGFILAGWLARVVTRILAGRRNLDQTLTPIIATLLRYFVLTVTFIAVLGQLGVQIASMLAVLGAAGLAIGLALQGTLSNIAAGIMLLGLRPFRAGEAIETGAVQGTVIEVGLFATTLRAPDGLFHFVPNSSLWNTPIKNLTRNAMRRIEVKFAMPEGTDIAAARKALLKIARADERIEKAPEPEVLVTGFGDKTIEFVLRAWARPTSHGRAAADLAERGRAALDVMGGTREQATEALARAV